MQQAFSNSARKRNLDLNRRENIWLVKQWRRKENFRYSQSVLVLSVDRRQLADDVHSLAVWRVDPELLARVGLHDPT